MIRTFSLPAIGLLAAAAFTSAADWPQWRGPDRTELSKETGLLKTWPADGPKVLWTFEGAGLGYSGPAVVGDRLYSLGATQGGQEFAFALDTTNGRKLWEQPIGTYFENNYGGGPRATPTVAGDALYVLGPQGELVCVATADGKVRWARNMLKDLGGRIMSGWGYSESVLVDGEQVVCTPGGPKGTLAAFDKKTGEILWRSKDVTDAAGYSSVIVAEVAGVRQYIQQTDEAVIGVAAKDGKLLWRHLVPKVRKVAVIPTPIYHDGYVYVTSGYGCGCDLIQLTRNEAGDFKTTEVYRNKNMINHHGGVVLVGDYLYGYSDEDVKSTPRRKAGWVCQEFKTGKIVWQSDKLDKGSLTYADGTLYCYGQGKGELVCIKATPKGWEETGRFKLPRETKLRKRSGGIWTHPVIANGRLYLRDQELLFCFDVREAAARQ